MKIYIDRSKWRTGGDDTEDSNVNVTGKGVTALLNPEGYMCCLGFVCKQSTPDVNILGMGEPCEIGYDVIDGITEDNDGWYTCNTVLTGDAILINDNSESTPQEKELSLKELFSHSPYELVFQGEFGDT